MTKNDRANFGTKLGVILASAGSAVGLGNIWRFPYETGNHGGAAFIIFIWVVFFFWDFRSWYPNFLLDAILAQTPPELIKS